MNNWLLNTTGRPDGFIPVDLLQEHLNYWIKTFYQAQGSNASWDWLAMISPCINILRVLAAQINATLGSNQGLKHHNPDTSLDIRELMDSMRRYQVYEKVLGRIIDGPSPVVQDLLVAGLHEMQKPLDDYNEAFGRLQKRRGVRPLLDEDWVPPTVTSTDAENKSSRAASRRPESEASTDTEDLNSSSSSSSEAGADGGGSYTGVHELNESMWTMCDEGDELNSWLESVDGTHEQDFRCSLETEEDTELFMD